MSTPVNDIPDCCDREDDIVSDDDDGNDYSDYDDWRWPWSW